MSPPLKQGDWLDVVDSDGIWNVARVLRLPSAGTVEVQYDGWGGEYDEVLRRDSPRIAPYGTYTSVVKCWAKLGSWPWWPALVTIRTPASDLGARNLRLEPRLHVDFLDDEDFEGHSRCWVKKKHIMSYHHTEDARERHDMRPQKKKTEPHPSNKKPTAKTFQLSERLLQRSGAREDLPQFEEGTLPIQYSCCIAPPTKEIRQKRGERKWLRSFANNRHKHAATHAYALNTSDISAADSQVHGTLYASAMENDNNDGVNSGGKRKISRPNNAAATTAAQISTDNPRKARRQSRSPKHPLTPHNEVQKSMPSVSGGHSTRTKRPKNLTSSSPCSQSKEHTKNISTINDRGSAPGKTASDRCSVTTAKISAQNAQVAVDSGAKSTKVQDTANSPAPKLSSLSERVTDTAQELLNLKNPLKRIADDAVHLRKRPKASEKSAIAFNGPKHPVAVDAVAASKPTGSAAAINSNGLSTCAIGTAHVDPYKGTNSDSTNEDNETLVAASSASTRKHAMPTNKNESTIRATTSNEQHATIKSLVSSTSEDQESGKEHRPRSPYKTRHAAPTGKGAVKLPSTATQKAASEQLHRAPRKYGKTPKVIKVSRKASDRMPLYFSPYATTDCEPRTTTSASDGQRENIHRSRKPSAQHVTAGHGQQGEPLSTFPRDVAHANSVTTASDDSSTRHVNVEHQSHLNEEEMSKLSGARSEDKHVNPMEFLSRLTERILQTGVDLHILEAALEDKIAELLDKSARGDELRKSLSTTTMDGATRGASQSTRRRLKRQRARTGADDADQGAAARRLSHKRAATQRPDHKDIASKSVSNDSLQRNLLCDGSTERRLRGKASCGQAAAPSHASFSSQKISPRSSILRFGGSWREKDTARDVLFGESSWRNADHSNVLDSRKADYRCFTFSLNDNFSMSQWYQDVQPRSYSFQSP